MIQIHEKTFVTLSLSLIGTMVTLVFIAGMAYAQFTSLKVEVVALRTDFNKYVIDPKLNMSSALSMIWTSSPRRSAE